MKSFQIVFLLIFLFQSGCGDFSSKQPSKKQGTVVQGSLPEEFFKPNEGPFTEVKMLSNLITNVFIPAADRFQVTSSQLATSVNLYCEALKENEAVEDAFEELKRDFRRNLIAFHQVDAVPFGPYTANNRRLADTVYAWPLLNSCGLDQQTLGISEGRPVEIEKNLINQRGLQAVEYLLFDESQLSRCNFRAFPQMKSWNEKPLIERKLQRCQLARLVAEDVKEKAQELKSSWDPQDGNFVKALFSGQLFRSEKEAVNSLSDAVLNIDRLKDERLAKPMGRYRTCSEDSCPESVEHRQSGFSWLAVETQLKTFEAVYFGSTDSSARAYGFDDMLRFYGHADVADRVSAAFSRALGSVREMAKQNRSFESQILEMDTAACKRSTVENREVEICSVHADVREVAALFKTEVLLALSLRAPTSAQGDND